MNARSQELLVLTATVNASFAPHTAVRNADTRLSQYLESFKKWQAWTTAAGNIDVIVVENSGFDLKNVVNARLGARDWNFIQYTADEREHRAGKGVGEAGIIDRVAAHLTSEPCRYGSVLKATGRLAVRNIARLAVPRGSGIWVQCRISKNLAEVDTRFFRCSPHFWTEYMSALGPEIDEKEGVFFEHIVAQRALKSILDGGTLEAFSRTPRIEGQSGSTGADYGWVRAYLVDQLNALGKRLVTRQYV